GIEQQPVLRRVEDTMQRQRELHDAEVWPEVPTGAGHLRHQEVPDLGREDLELLVAQAAQVLRARDGFQQGAFRLTRPFHVGPLLRRAHGQPVYRPPPKPVPARFRIATKRSHMRAGGAYPVSVSVQDWAGMSRATHST